MNVPSMVSEMVERHLPSTWQNPGGGEASVSHTLFTIYKVERQDELEAVTREIKRTGFLIGNVQRLQNITMYGRYLLRHTQLSYRNEGREIESIRYICIDSKHINTIAVFNIDYRRLGLPKEAFDLCATPAEADLAYGGDNHHMVVCRVSREGPTTTFDSEIYPEYIVKYHRLYK